MKIGFVLDDTLDSTDGVQQYVLTFGDWLAKSGHQVHYLVGESTRTDIPNVHSMSKNIKVKFNKNRMSIPLPANKAKIKKMLGTLNLDLIHIQMPYSPQMGARVINSVNSKTAVVATFHILPYSQKERLATKLLAKSVRKSSRRIDQLVSVSEPAAKFAATSFGLSSIVIPNPVVFPKHNLSKKNTSAVKIVYLGRLVARKGALELIEAYKVLIDRNPKTNILLEIGGSGHLHSKIKEFIDQNELNDKVKLLGFVAENDKQRLLSSADIAVFPSMGGESFGIVLTEAMANGSGVVIGGDNPGYRSVLKEDIFLFNPKNTLAFARKLEILIEDKDLRRELHKQQQRLVRQYNINVVGPKIVEVYQTSIAKNKQ